MIRVAIPSPLFSYTGGQRQVELESESLAALLEALDRLFLRRVDLVTDSSIRNPYFREAVEKEQQTLYAAA